MIDAVAEAIRDFEKLAPDPETVGACPELPGIVLDRILGRALDRKGEEYLAAIKDYDKIRNEYFQTLADPGCQSQRHLRRFGSRLRPKF